MKIPSILNNLLQKSDLCGAVTASLSEFKPWISSERPPFFPEYTDHGVNHIEAVFETAQSLIKDESWKVFTSSDAVTMLLAILLHDSAMHITPDSFIVLINKDNIKYRIADLDEKTWYELWQDFISEASRFDGRKLTDLFGNTDPVHSPSLEPGKLTDRDKKLIGEFLRRYHHRLAHEIAIFGVCGPDNQGIKLNDSIPNDIADLAGLVARSHGMSVRSCIDYLQRNYGDKYEHKHVHAAYLMIVLRVADYLQIQSERAPKQILKVSKLQSPISKSYWNMHHVINDIRNTHADPEALYIHSIPKDIETFLRTKQLLHDIQLELDASWAVLGEVYGRMTANNLHLLGLKLRRIRSNLDEMETFAKQVKYVPINAAFDSANPDILKLLVNPLYNEDPAFGIRELIQNAVDAIHELQEYQKNHDLGKLDLPCQEADVIVSIDKNGETDDLWLTISDCGIGMTAQIIKEYFLRAAASFRLSDTWRKQFTDEGGRSRIPRSGRFGIGILAAFLIGNEIHVSTRYVSAKESEGIEFTATLDTQNIQLNYTKRSIGTEIRIKIFEKYAKEYTESRWASTMKWYALESPSVLCKINGNSVKSECILPQCVSQLPLTWRRVTIPYYRDVHWTYSSVPLLSCNGIKVQDKQQGFSALYDKEDIKILRPNISVFDFDGKLPLNLQRTRLSDPLCFDKELTDSIIRDFLALALIKAPTSHITDSEDLPSYESLGHPGIVFMIRALTLWFSTKSGTGLLDSWHMPPIEGEPMLVIPFIGEYQHLFKNKYPWKDSNAIGLHPLSLTDLYNNIYATTFENCIGTIYPESLSGVVVPPIIGAHVLVSLGFLNDILSRAGGFYKRNISAAIEDLTVISPYGKHLFANTSNWKTDNFCLFRFGDCPKHPELFIKIVNSVPTRIANEKGLILAQWYFGKQKTPVESSPIAAAWKKIIREPIIPYNPIERRKKLAHAFEELKPYIEVYENILKQGEMNPIEDS